MADQLSILMLQKLQLSTENEELKAKVANWQNIVTEILALKTENNSLRTQWGEREDAPRASEFVWKKEWAK